MQCKWKFMTFLLHVALRASQFYRNFNFFKLQMWQICELHSNKVHFQVRLITCNLVKIYIICNSKQMGFDTSCNNIRQILSPTKSKQQNAVMTTINKHIITNTIIIWHWYWSKEKQISYIMIQDGIQLILSFSK